MTLTVLANGCFDPFHYGHLLHLQEAATYGDRLVVALTRDASVRREKGVGRPAFSHDSRMAMLLALRIVHDVVLVDDAMEALQLVAPDVFVKGVDYAGVLRQDIVDYCIGEGIRIAFTSTPKFSATALLKSL